MSSRARTSTTFSGLNPSRTRTPLIFSELVINQELVRIGARGYGDGLNAGMVIGLPPVMNFGQEPLRSKVLDEVFSANKVSHLKLLMNQLTRRSSVWPFPRPLLVQTSPTSGARPRRARTASLGA